MTEPDPTYTATMEGLYPTPAKNTMPEWMRQYLIQRRRALKTEMIAINKLLGIKDN